MVNVDSRNLLGNITKVNALLDTASFNSLITQSDRVANAILGHIDSQLIEFLRTPLSTESPLLRRVPEYNYEPTIEGWINGLSITRSSGLERIYFGYRMNDVISIGQTIFGHQELTEQEMDRLLQVFVQATFRTIKRDAANLFITTDRILLRKRLWFESHFPGGILNIMTPAEASIFLDIFLKTRSKYLLSSHFQLNKGYWYLLSKRLKLPHYNVGDELIDALSKRFEFILMALDEIGTQFYLGTNNDTMDNELYHFNYFIILTTGIFDNLALKTNEQLGINFRDLRNVCLNNNGGREFLRAIRERNQTLRNHISAYMPFINLIYEFRELVVHRQGLLDMHSENRGDLNWRANFIAVNTEIQDRLRTCGDVQSDFDPFTEWGLYQMHDLLLLEPYHFALAVEKKLAEFIDMYLEILGSPSFIASARLNGDDFANTLNRFDKDHLGV